MMLIRVLKLWLVWAFMGVSIFSQADAPSTAPSSAPVTHPLLNSQSSEPPSFKIPQSDFRSVETRSIRPTELGADPIYNLAYGMWYLQEPAHPDSNTDHQAYSPLDVLAMQGWQRNQGDAGNLGYSSHAYWFHIPLSVATSDTWYILIKYALHDHVDFYWVQGGEVLEHMSTGDGRPFDERPIKLRDTIIKRTLSADEQIDLVFRIKTMGSYQVPVSAYRQYAFEQYIQQEDLVRGAYYGVMLVMLLYNIMIFIATRTPAYRNYVMYVAAFVLMQLSYDGLGFQYLWPESPWLNRWMLPFFLNISLLLFVYFTYTFLELDRASPKLQYSFISLMAVSLLLIMMTPFLPYALSVKLSNVMSTPIILGCFFAASWLAYHGKRFATVFAVASAIFVAGLVTGSLRSLGLVESNFLTLHGYMIGSVIEVVLLALALGMRITDMREAQFLAENKALEAQERAIANLQRYERMYESALNANFIADPQGSIRNGNAAFWALIQQDKKEDCRFQDCFQDVNLAQELLEKCHRKHGIQKMEIKTDKGYWVLAALHSVELEGERIIEGSLLNIEGQKAAEAIKEQADKDKMNALQQLVVGVSHELNSPLGVVRTSADFARAALDKLMSGFGTGSLTKQRFKETVTEGTEALALVEDNLARVTNLIENFKQVSVQQMQLHIGQFNSAQLVDQVKEWANQRGIALELEVQDDHPESFTTFPDAVTLIVKEWIENSAAHSQVEALKVNMGIHVKASELMIHYFDNGLGMEPQLQKQIFDPFFTTQRGVQKKIGLGLYQVHNIAHQLLKGRLYLDQVSPLLRDQPQQLVFILSVPNLDKDKLDSH